MGTKVDTRKQGSKSAVVVPMEELETVRYSYEDLC